MKYVVLLLLAGLSITSTAQNPYAIRESIAGSIAALNTEPEDVFKVINQEISSGSYTIQVRVYYPSDAEALPIIFHIHGGAWIAGNLDTHDTICRRLAVETNAIVIAIDYRRPPEHQYPTALNDCFFILNWIDQNKKMLKGDGRLFLIGDSAGGGLVPALCIKNKTLDTPVKIDGQILINPATDLRPDSVSYQSYGVFIDWYVPSDIDKSNALLSPLVFEDYSQFPKAIIVVSEHDQIKNDGLQFHQNMIESGNASVIYELGDMGHLGALWAGNAPSVNLAFEFIIDAYKKWIKD